MKMSISLVLFCGFLFHVINAQGTKNGLERLQWLAGCWETSFQGRVIEEQWMKPLGQMMVGTGRTTSKGKSVFFEFLQIVHADSGIFYIARPKGNPPTPFKLIKAANNEIVFENLSHDFPQRVMYTAGVDELFARVEGMVKGELRFEEFRYRRIKCE